MREFVEAVAAEVLRRLRVMEEKKRLLVVVTEDTEEEALSLLLGAYGTRGLTPTFLSFLKEPQPEGLRRIMEGQEVLRSGALRHLKGRSLLEGYQGLLVTELGFPALKGISDLAFSGDLGGLVFEALRQGKPVHVLAKDLEDVRNPVLHAKMQGVLQDLEAMGLTALSPKRVKDGGQGGKGLGQEGRSPWEDLPQNRKPRDPGPPRRRHMALKELLLLVEDTGHGPTVHLPAHTRLTMAARDHVKEKGIRLVPRKDM